VDLFELQCAYAAVHTAKCDLITIPHEMHPDLFSVSIQSQIYVSLLSYLKWSCKW